MIFFEKIKCIHKTEDEKVKLQPEHLTGIAAAILKLGIISVAVIGVNMLMAGEVSALVYIAFFNAYSKYLSSYRRNNHLYVNDSYA